METKNLGQIAGLWIGAVAPKNLSLIWYDNTPSIRAHKVYDFGIKAWTILNKDSIFAITYPELKNLARSKGLTQGSWFKILDRANALALAITISKVQYVDNNNNFIIDDLAASATYVVNSQNLLIDDIRGVWDSKNNELKYSFSEINSAINGVEGMTLWGKFRNKLYKIKIRNLISPLIGNSIEWNRGFYFNFFDSLKRLYDIKGGVVSKDTYNKDKGDLETSITNVASSNQSNLETSKKYTDEAVKDSEIFNKTAPKDILEIEPTDIKAGDSINKIFSKIMGYVKKLSFANGINLSKNFTTDKTGSVNNNDTVESAISKLQNQHDNAKWNLPEDFKPSAESYQPLKPKDEYSVCFSKIEAERKNVYALETPWTTSSINTGNSLDKGVVKYRIHNGFLEISIPNGLTFAWMYTRTEIDDRVLTNSFNFSQSIVDKIIPFLPKTDRMFDYFDVYPLMELGIGVINNAPNHLITASLKFGYTRDSYQNLNKLCIAYVPLQSSRIETSGGTKFVVQNGKDVAFQNMEGIGESPTLYVPPMLIRYKIC